MKSITQLKNEARRRVFVDAFNGGYIVHGYQFENTKEHVILRDALCDLERRVIALYGLTILCADGSLNNLTDADRERVEQVHGNAVKHATRSN